MFHDGVAGVGDVVDSLGLTVRHRGVSAVLRGLQVASADKSIVKGVFVVIDGDHDDDGEALCCWLLQLLPL